MSWSTRYANDEKHEDHYKYIKRQGDKWVVIQKGTGKVLSHHDSREKAIASFRAMMMNKHGAIRTAVTSISQETLDEIKKEHEHLTTVERGRVADMLQAAAALGDRSESGDWQAAKKAQSDLDRRVSQLEDILDNHVLVSTPKSTGTDLQKVQPGLAVHLDNHNEDGTTSPSRHILMGITESLYRRPNSDYTVTPPEGALGRALMNRSVGDRVHWLNSKGGLQTASISKIADAENATPGSGER